MDQLAYGQAEDLKALGLRRHGDTQDDEGQKPGEEPGKTPHSTVGWD